LAPDVAVAQCGGLIGVRRVEEVAEESRAPLPVGEEPVDETWGTHELGLPVQTRGDVVAHRDDPDLDGAVSGERACGEQALLDELVDMPDAEDLLLVGNVRGQLGAPVADRVHRHGHAGALVRVDLDHPELLWGRPGGAIGCDGPPGVHEFPDRRVLGVDAVPVHVPAHAYGAEQGGHGRGSQDHRAGDPVGGVAVHDVTAEYAEPAAPHVGGADQKSWS
jgi:hypothetical protein